MEVQLNNNYMKRIAWMLPLLVTITLSFSCGKLQELEDRVAKLETLCARMNSNIQAMQTIVTALQRNERIESVSALPNDSGYAINFTSGSVMVYPDENSTSVISVKEDADGLWYWTINGEWLYVNGEKALVSNEKEVIVPKLKIEEDLWYISFDDGKSWQKTGTDGLCSGISSVSQDGSYVCFKLNNGEEIKIAKRLPLTISFSTDDVAVADGGASKTIGYTLTGASEKVVVKSIVQEGWKAVVSQETCTSGIITITAPTPLTESEILIFVSDSGQTVLAVLNCVKSTIVLSQEVYNVSSKGGDLTVGTTANTNFNVVIPDEAQSWLCYLPTKSLSEMTLNLKVAKNENSLPRNANVHLTDENGVIIRTFLVSQAGNMEGLVEIQVVTKGELHSALAAYDKACIKKMKITGTLDDTDFLDIYYEMPALRYLDISEVDIEALPKESFYQSQNVETIILPKSLVTIPCRCFASSHISGCIEIPASCETIGESAFASTKLSAISFDSGSRLKSIGYKAFGSCKNLTSITIPATCTILAIHAFDCSGLKKIVFESGSVLTTIDDYAFYCCSLENITIPGTCKRIGSEAFYSCSLLEDVSFGSPSSLKEIDWSAFGECKSLKRMEIPSSCTSIEHNAFQNCVNLKNVILSGTIGSSAFINCGSLESVTFQNNCYAIYEKAFYNCTSLTDLSFGSQCAVSTIGISAFENCPLVHRIDMSGCTKLSTLGNKAFYGNDQIYFLKLGTASPPKLGENVFGNVGVYSVLKVPSGAVSQYQKTTGWNKFSSITALE